MGAAVTHASDGSNYKFLKVWGLQDVQTGELRCAFTCYWSINSVGNMCF
jgi:hypothetical protein